MSGTSLDGLDGVLVALPDGPSRAATLCVLAHVHRPFAESLRAELAALNAQGGADELHRAAVAGNALARLSAEVVGRLLSATDLDARDIVAIGSHGQTVRHRPDAGDAAGVDGYTLQLNAPALLAERTGIDVVADFRSRDVAAGGQGAPLVPAFHRAFFGGGKDAGTTVVLNLGGMANVTLLGADGTTRGFDTGPGNVFLDLWCQRATGQPFDAGGALAARGRADERLLRDLLDEPWFDRVPPKSTGRDLLDSAWLDARLTPSGAADRLAAADVQATLAALTARTAADAVRRHAADARSLVVCGGGAANGDLVQRLRDELPGLAVETSDARGLPPTQVEATAFAWLAAAFTARLPAGLPDVTGARGPRLLGALWPAGTGIASPLA
jgi:anhydro-N-acetylmuramic acid kinase